MSWQMVTAAVLAAGAAVYSPDPYYPQDGNEGYDVQCYDVHVAYDPAAPDRFTGDTTITLRATERLDRFSLDLDGFTVTSAEIDGVPARNVSREGAHELVIQPRTPIAATKTVAVRVRYQGRPTGDGWHTYANGGAVALGEPHSAAAWFPANDHPSDKATFRLTATVPDGWRAISIGRPEKTASATTQRWVEDRPVATYLTTIAIDKFTVRTATTPDGLPLIFAYAPGKVPDPDSEALLPEIQAFLTDMFGPYPFSTSGATVINAIDGEEAPMALETQGRPTYQDGFFDASMVHEMTHQWFGNSVSFRDWRDGCIAECFAQYANLLWEEHHGGMNLDQDFYLPAVEAAKDDPEYWQVHLYDPGPGKELDSALYFRGQMMLHALRRKIGDGAFFGTLKQWTSIHRYGNASFLDFEKLAAQVSRADLTEFFTEWAHSSVVPSQKNLYPGTLSVH